MLVSMTGYGQGEASNRFGRVAVEIRSVNHRYLDLSIKMPRVLSHREHEVKDLIKDQLRRGRVSITVTADGDEPSFQVRMNMPLMDKYVEELRAFQKRKSITGDLDINTLATLPEVFQLLEKEQDADRLWPLVKKSLQQASESCNRMREREGKTLEKDLRQRIASVKRTIRRIEKRAPRVIAAHNVAFKNRVTKLMNGAKLDQDRWLTELSLMVDRLDFTEEVTRLQSHVDQIEACLNEGGAVSKRLTYLLQEVHRESTTIGSKASDAQVIEQVVALKEESERLREQVQNLE